MDRLEKKELERVIHAHLRNGVPIAYFIDVYKPLSKELQIIIDRIISYNSKMMEIAKDYGEVVTSPKTLTEQEVRNLFLRKEDLAKLMQPINTDIITLLNDAIAYKESEAPASIELDNLRQNAQEAIMLVKANERVEHQIKIIEERLITNYIGHINLFLDYFFKGIPFDQQDATSYGLLGLSNAINQYKSCRIIDFMAFMTPFILDEVKKNFAELSGHTWKEYSSQEALRYYDNWLIAVLNHNEMTIPEIQSEHTISLTDLIIDDLSDRTVLDKLYKEKMIEVLSTLNPMESQILILRFGLNQCEPMTRLQIGRLLKVTPEVVRSIEERALKRLRHPLRSRTLKEIAQHIDEEPMPTTFTHHIK